LTRAPRRRIGRCRAAPGRPTTVRRPVRSGPSSAGNFLVVALFAASWFLRRDDPARPPLAALVLSFAGVGLSLVTAWLGGELVDRLGIGVSDGAHVDAPSSLDGKATARAQLRS